MTKYKFLSDEWIEQARAIADDYADDLPEPPEEIKLNATVSDIPHRNGETLHAHLSTVGGSLVVELGHLEDAEVTVSVDYETARPVLMEPDPQTVMGLFMAGKILIEGDATKLIAMQTIEPDPDSAAMAEEIAAITEY